MYTDIETVVMSDVISDDVLFIELFDIEEEIAIHTRASI